MQKIQHIPIMEYPMYQTQDSSSGYSGDYLQVAYFTSNKGVVENILMGIQNPAKGDAIRAYIPLEALKLVVSHAENINKQIDAEKQKSQKAQQKS